MKSILPILFSFVLILSGCDKETSSSSASNSGPITVSAKSISPASSKPGANQGAVKAQPNAGASKSAGQAIAKPGNKVKDTTVTLTASAKADAESENSGARIESNQATVKLLDAGGAEGRLPLRYKFKVGHSEPMVMRMKMAMEMEVPGMGTQKVDMPVMVMRMTTTLRSVEADGSAKLSFSIDKADVEPGGNPMVAAQIKTLLEKFSGIKGEYGITSRGITTDTKVDMSGVTDPQVKKTMLQMRQSMEQASSPLPVEAIGVGARWEVRQLVSADGMKVRQRVEYKLTARNGDIADLETILSQEADKQTISTPEMNGVTAELESYQAKGTGVLKTNLAGLVPTGSMQLKNNVVMSAQGQKMVMGLEMKVELGSK